MGDCKVRKIFMYDNNAFTNLTLLRFSTSACSASISFRKFRSRRCRSADSDFAIFEFSSFKLSSQLATQGSIMYDALEFQHFFVVFLKIRYQSDTAAHHGWRTICANRNHFWEGKAILTKSWFQSIKYGQSAESDPVTFLGTKIHRNVVYRQQFVPYHLCRVFHRELVRYSHKKREPTGFGPRHDH